jgi:hypothetical protein
MPAGRSTPPAAIPPARGDGRTVHLRATPQTVSWGFIDAELRPVLRVRSGETVSIDTVTHQGLNARGGPVARFGAAGIPASDVLPDAIEIFEQVRRADDAGPHLLMSPAPPESRS